MKREGVWKMIRKSTAMKTSVFGIIMVLSLAHPAVAAGRSSADSSSLVLPSAQELITMSIDQRLAMFEAMRNLPTNQRNANSKALYAEIDSLSPQEKTEMENHFRAEFNAMTPARQDEVMKKLQALRPQ